MLQLMPFSKAVEELGLIWQMQPQESSTECQAEQMKFLQRPNRNRMEIAKVTLDESFHKTCHGSCFKYIFNVIEQQTPEADKQINHILIGNQSLELISTH